MTERTFLDQNPFWCQDIDIEPKDINFFQNNIEIQKQEDLFQQFFKKESFQFTLKQSSNSTLQRQNDQTTENKLKQVQLNQIQKKNEILEECQIRQLRKHRKSTLKKAVYDQVVQENQSQQNDSQSIFTPNTSFKNSSQTKNIPKNFGRAIVSFILSNKKIIQDVMEGRDKNTIMEFKQKLMKMKKNIKTIQGIRQMWVGERNMFSKQMRMLSQLFLRKHCLPYIFNSRIKNHALNIKYRGIIMRGLKNPQNFTHLKQF